MPSIQVSQALVYFVCRGCCRTLSFVSSIVGTQSKPSEAKVWFCVFFKFIVSNEVPEHPCVSPSSNCVFERRLIEKYIAENGTDPISGEQISEEQLIDIKGIKLFYFS